MSPTSRDKVPAGQLSQKSSKSAESKGMGEKLWLGSPGPSPQTPPQSLRMASLSSAICELSGALSLFLGATWVMDTCESTQVLTEVADSAEATGLGRASMFSNIF